MDEKEKILPEKLFLDNSDDMAIKGASLQSIVDHDVVVADLGDRVKRCEAMYCREICTIERESHDRGANVSLVRTQSKIVNEKLVRKDDSEESQNNNACENESSLGVVADNETTKTAESHGKTASGGVRANLRSLCNFLPEDTN